MIQSTSLSDFRWSFLDAQNKAGFDKAGHRMVSEFRRFMMDEKMENQNDNDYITLYSSKKQIIFQWSLDGDTFEIVLFKDAQNKASIKLSNLPPVKHDKITLYDKEIVKQISDFISLLFTGNDFDILPNN